MSAEKYRARMAELNVEIERLQREMSEKRSKGKPVHDLERKLDQLERNMTSSNGSRPCGVPG